MKLDQVFKVENDIASVDIAVTSLGTADLTSEQEKELLANYNISFLSFVTSVISNSTIVESSFGSVVTSGTPLLSLIFPLN